LRQLYRGLALAAAEDELGFVVVQFHHEKELDLRQNGSRH